MGNLENLQRNGSDRFGIGRVCHWDCGLGLPPQTIALADENGAADQFSCLCMRTSPAWHRRRTPLELLLDGVPVEVEHALAARGSCDLHVDLRHDSSGG